MNEAENEVQFVELVKCTRCKRSTDLICVSCDHWFCFDHVIYCVQCEQPVCEGCYKEDNCCLVRPWGEKTVLGLRDFYRNKLIDSEAMNTLCDAVEDPYNEEQPSGTKRNELRKEVVKRSVAFFVDKFDASFCSSLDSFNSYVLIAEFFPRVSKYVENEETRLKFVDFMKKIAESKRFLFAKILVYSEDRNELISMVGESIRDHNFVLIEYSLRESGKALFDCLKNRGLLDWGKVVLIHHPLVGHIDGMKWIESNGINATNNEEEFVRFGCHASKQVKEYLASKEGKAIEYLIRHKFLDLEDLELIYKFKGLEAIEGIEVQRTSFEFEEVKFLKCVGYKFNKISERIDFGFHIYTLLIFNVLKYGDLNEQAKKILEHYVSKYDIKACKHMYRHMKEIRKRKIMTVILCIRKTYPRFQKEIIWNILDYAYSPRNERGSL